MSLNIPNDVLEMCSSVELTIETARLGPRQRGSLKRMVETGHLKGYSVPMVIARRIRKDAGMPIIHNGRYNRIYFHNIPPTLDAFYTEMTRGAAAAALEYSGEERNNYGGRDWRQDQINNALDFARYRSRGGTIHCFAEHFDFSNIKLPKMEMPELPAEFKVDWQLAEKDYLT